MMMEGVRLMAVGMFAVFTFLTLLVGLMKASAAIFQAHAHRFPEELARPAVRAVAGAQAAEDQAELALAIALARAGRAGRRI
jgi:Na+-transporting methylmalonyl-CoA/oxaloacetate decarboxylase gamma subunit